MKKLLVVAAVGIVGYYVAKKVIERKNEEVIENVEGEIVVDSDEEIEDLEKETNNDKINDKPKQHKIRKAIMVIIIAPIMITALPCIMAIEEGRKIIKRRIKVHKAGKVILDEIKNRL